MSKKTGWWFIDIEESWWYIEGENSKSLYIGYWNEDTGVLADIKITWHELGRWSVPKLEAFDDSWKALYLYGERFLETLSWFNNKNISKDKLKQELLKISFKDETEYKK